MAPRATATGVHWSKAAPPKNLHERMVFLDACQKHFEHVAVLGPVSDKLSFPGEADSLGAPLGATFVAPSEWCTTAAVSARCVVCQQPTSSAVVCNPFSDWLAPVCAACGRTT